VTKRWQVWITVLLGVWLIASPWILGYAGRLSAAGEAYLIGVAIMAIALLARVRPQRWQEWTAVTLGVGLALSPWVLAFSDLTAPTWNMVAVGTITATVDGWGLD
jgi:hypothetical protein